MTAIWLAFYKGYRCPNATLAFHCNCKSSRTFEPDQGNAMTNITGRWDVSITRANGTIRKAVAELSSMEQAYRYFLTPSADYRYLDGVVTETL